MDTALQQADDQIHAAIAAPTASDELALFEPRGHAVWKTASGQRLRHTIYSLIGCPPSTAATFVLVRRGQNGRRTALAIRRTMSKVASVNLARIRKSGARLGADEVHVYETGATATDRASIVADLRAGCKTRR